MNKGDNLKDYYKTLEEAPDSVLEAYKDEVLSTIEDYKKAGDEKKVKELQQDLIKLGELMEKRREK